MGTEVRGLHAAQPHEVHITAEELLHLPAGIDVLEIGIEDHLQQHARMIRRTAEGLVRFQQICDVKGVNYAAQKTDMVRLRDFFHPETKEKARLVLDCRI